MLIYLLECDACRFREDDVESAPYCGRVRTLRERAREKGWRHIRKPGRIRDICADCVKRDKAEGIKR